MHCWHYVMPQICDSIRMDPIARRRLVWCGWGRVCNCLDLLHSDAAQLHFAVRHIIQHRTDRQIILCPASTSFRGPAHRKHCFERQSQIYLLNLCFDLAHLWRKTCHRSSHLNMPNCVQAPLQRNKGRTAAAPCAKAPHMATYWFVHVTQPGGNSYRQNFTGPVPALARIRSDGNPQPALLLTASRTYILRHNT